MGRKRNKVEKYAGIYYRDVARLDGQGMERMYYVTYRRGGRESPVVEEPVGRASEGWTPAKANLERAKRIAGVELTNTERRKEAEAEKKKGGGPVTIGRLWEIYCATLEAKPQQRKDDTSRAFYLTSLFNKLVPELTTGDVDNLARKLARTYGKANPDKLLSPQTQKHILALLKRLLRYGDAQGLCQYPVGLKISIPKVDNQKTEIMSAEQLTAYWRALDEEQDQIVASMLRVALLTGIRKTALFSLEWNDVDFERGIIKLRGEVAKSDKTQYVPLNKAVRSILEHIEHTGSRLIWPSPQTGARRKSIAHVAARVRDKAGLPKDFRPLHGLRHVFASHLASSGQVSLYELQKLLTHSSPLMTQRYAHLADEAMKRAASVADTMLNVGYASDENKEY